MAKCRLWVYNAENFFVASGHPFAPVIRRTKRNSKKVFFWDTLINSQTNQVPVLTFFEKFHQVVVESTKPTHHCYLVALCQLWEPRLPGMAVCHFNHSSVKGRVLSDAQLKVHCSVAGGGQCPSAFCCIAAGYIRERWKGKVLIQHKKERFCGSCVQSLGIFCPDLIYRSGVRIWE